MYADAAFDSPDTSNNYSVSLKRVPDYDSHTFTQLYTGIQPKAG